MTLPWRLTKDELPTDDAEVLASVNGDIHFCVFSRSGPSPEDGIFDALTLPVIFLQNEVQYWMYKSDLAASVPSNPEVHAERTTSHKSASRHDNEDLARIIKLRSLLRHAAQRNHKSDPRCCTPCEEIEKELAK